MQFTVHCPECKANLQASQTVIQGELCPECGLAILVCSEPSNDDLESDPDDGNLLWEEPAGVELASTLRSSTASNEGGTAKTNTSGVAGESITKTNPRGVGKLLEKFKNMPRIATLAFLTLLALGLAGGAYGLLSGFGGSSSGEKTLSTSGSGLTELYEVDTDGKQLPDLEPTAPISLRERDVEPLADSEAAHGFLFDGGGRVVLLASTMADFALNPRTGDIAGIDPNSNRAMLFRKTQLETGKTDAAPQILLDHPPRSIIYKRFEDLEVYAVICGQEPRMQIIDANDFTILRMVTLRGGGISHVTTSSNPKDPFVYYFYGSGHDSASGVVDLRTMVDRGIVMSRVKDCTFAADGRIAYPRGAFSPSGIEALQMTTDFADDVPRFLRLYYDLSSGGPYVPGPFGEFTASLSGIYTRDLSTQVASLDFIPACFFRTRPILVGYDETSNLQAASYNTFDNVGRKVQLPKSVTDGASMSPGSAGVPKKPGDQKLKWRIFADDKNSRVIYAFRDKIAIVPLTDFDLPEEPFMVLDETSFDLTVGKTNSLNISPTSPQVTLDYGELPKGVTRTETGLEWIPQDEDVGLIDVPVTLVFNDKRRPTNLNLHVAQPHLDAPFEIEGLLIDNSAAFAVVWTGTPFDEDGRPLKLTTHEPRENEIAIIPFRPGLASRQKTIPFVVKQALIVGRHLAILPALADSQVEIYDIATLNRVRTLNASEPLIGITTSKNQLVLQTAASVEVYDGSSLERVLSLDSTTMRSSEHSIPKSAEGSVRDGIVVAGVLFDLVENKPKLELTSRGFLAPMGYAGAKAYLLRKLPPEQPKRSVSRIGTSIVGGPLPIPERGISVLLEKTTAKPAGMEKASLLKHEITLVIQNASGKLLRRVPISRQTRTANDWSDKQPPLPESVSETMFKKQPPPPLLQIVDDKVFVTDRTSIYRWVAQDFERLKEPPVDKNEPFHIVPEQDTFYSAEELTGLTHRTRGGQPPYKYSLIPALDGVTINPQTGVATIERRRVLADATAALRSLNLGNELEVSKIAARIQAATVDMLEPAIELIGRKPNGFLLAVPIHLQAIDNQGNASELQYFVFLDIPFEEAANEWKKFVQAIQSKR